MTDLRALELRWRARAETLRPDRELAGLASTFQGQRALEIGGPSALFRLGGRFPIYPELAALDAANYAQTTIWEESEGWDRSPTSSFVLEAGNLDVIGDASYDVVLASHVIEHLANPLGALREWARVLRPDGRLVLVAPHREGTFDRRRPVTTLAHLRADEQARTPETDLTHLPEILDLHDLGRDPLAGDREAFAARSRDNAVHRALHHHVFDTRSLMDAVEAVGFYVTSLACRRPYHVIVTASKDAEARMPAAERDAVLCASPFRQDHRAARS